MVTPSATPSGIPRISIKDANDILIHNVPGTIITPGNTDMTDPVELLGFPFGDQLYLLWTQNGYKFQLHGRPVISNMNILLSDKPESILVSGAPSSTFIARIRQVQTEIGGFFGGFSEETKFFFRLAALYHDIGKYIINERHPVIGRYTLDYLDPEEKNALKALLSENEDLLQLLIEMVQSHDQFGVLSTGEASYPIILNAVSTWGKSCDLQKRIISAIMWLNIADICGVVGLTIYEHDLMKVMDDWQWYMDTLTRCSANQERASDYILRHAADEERVIQRIARLLIEASRKTPSRYVDLSYINPHTNETRAHKLVRDQLKTVFPTVIPRRDFAYQFTHVCKMDYAKRFFECLVDYCEGPSGPTVRSLTIWANKRIDNERLIYAVLAILRRITSTYAAMIDTKEGPGNLIGVEMKDLTPGNAKSKTSQICKLLLESHYPGLSWIMSDCPTWYF